MNKKTTLILTMFLFPAFIYAHTLLLNVFDNENNTITIKGVFNTGQSAPGAQIRLESLITGKVLYKKRLPEESELDVQIPKEPYQIVLDGGPGHQMVKEGIPPIGGYLKKIIEKKKEIKISQAKNTANETSIPMIISITIAFLLLFLTIIISIKNTNKLIKVLQNN